MALFKKFLPRSTVVEFPAQSLLEKKEEVRTFSFKNIAISFEKYLKRRISSLKFRTLL